MARYGREVVIVDAVRTPIGRGHPEKGWYRDVHPADLLGLTYTEVIRRSGIDAMEIGDVVTGCVQQFGPQGFNIGRNAWLQEGLPIETPATTIDRQCGSAQQAVNFATALVASGIHECAIGSGVEHMGLVPSRPARRPGSATGARSRTGSWPGTGSSVRDWGRS
jgi:acetyl-CoA acyltransferase